MLCSQSITFPAVQLPMWSIQISHSLVVVLGHRVLISNQPSPQYSCIRLTETMSAIGRGNGVVILSSRIPIGNPVARAEHRSIATMHQLDAKSALRCFTRRTETYKVAIRSARSVASSTGGKRYVLFRKNGSLVGSGAKTSDLI